MTHNASARDTPADHTPVNDAPLYGLMAEFDTAEALVAAARQVQERGYRQMDAYAPFPVDGLAEAVGQRSNRVPLFVLVGGLVGGSLAYLMQYYSMVIDYPLNVGGRPLHSWPAFIPITFELTVLFAAFGAVIGMLVLNGLPRPYHPVFNAPGFERASQTGFFLCVEARDPLFDRTATRRLLEDLHPRSVTTVDP